MSEEKIRPCPYCGCENPQIRSICGLFGEKGYYVMCLICGWLNGAYRMRWKAIRRWNKLHFNGRENDGETS